MNKAFMRLRWVFTPFGAARAKRLAPSALTPPHAMAE
jgi:hypothetical protein